MSDPSNTSSTGYDIQGQLASSDSKTSIAPPSGYSAPGAYSSYSPAGEGEPLIPSTSPGLQDPVIPGKEKTESQKKDLVAQGDVKQDPLTSAIGANADALKSAGVVTMSQADVNEQVLSKGVLGAVPSSSV